MDEIDYSKYSREELADILNHIDRKKYPDRAAEAQSIYDALGGTSELQEEIRKRPKIFWFGLLCIAYAPYVMVSGLQTNRLFYSISIESLEARVVTGLALLAFGVRSIMKLSKNEN